MPASLPPVYVLCSSDSFEDLAKPSRSFRVSLGLPRRVPLCCCAKRGAQSIPTQERRDVCYKRTLDHYRYDGRSWSNCTPRRMWRTEASSVGWNTCYPGNRGAFRPWLNCWSFSPTCCRRHPPEKTRPHDHRRHDRLSRRQRHTWYEALSCSEQSILPHLSFYILRNDYGYVSPTRIDEIATEKEQKHANIDRSRSVPVCRAASSGGAGLGYWPRAVQTQRVHRWDDKRIEWRQVLEMGWQHTLVGGQPGH